MEDIVQVFTALIVIGVAIFSSINKRRRSIQAQEAYEETEEAPFIELTDEEVTTHRPARSSQPPRPRTKRPTPTPQAAATAAEPASAAPAPQATNALTKEAKERLHTPQRAREAFIYSQIFTRKYQ
jgi:hypothetical protein